MELNKLNVKFPKHVLLEDKTRVKIENNMMGNENLFSLLYPEKYTDNIAINLIKHGFKDATPSIFKGERYSMSREVEFPWEIHLRLFNYKEYYGKISAHVEISRKYFEHLFIIQPVVYEPFQYYQSIYKTFKVLYEPENKVVSKFIDNYNVELIPPDNLIEWMPVVLNLYNSFTIYKEKIREILDEIDYNMHRK